MKVKKKKVATKKTVKKEKVSNEELFFELTGGVDIVTKKKGKETSRETLGGDVVLQCLVNMLMRALDEYEWKNIPEQKQLGSS